ncbi:beta-ketoacyl-[acyl-carrier-protein] synthase family protein [Paenibacillus sp. PR3]|uniref:Beta-ketoacyl-[acyl-carrier-protein] synthase family protein n=1 Tax=Paenibacillus terricola TaxID=2763503 RepID=A0ABR8N201_9BACL|nr:beta-ketoacyl-[acyl-carrier-protein] synthase family protein [Paenibacillus terricola]MBD3922205.1 beta-ketoacyl-[acyl-carrier-protein] synthase family protein [Paenibacillus terricola]
MRRVVVTGIGTVSSLGDNLQKVWTRMLAGESGIRRISSMNPDKFMTKFAGEVDNFSPDEYITSIKNRELMSRGEQLCFASAAMAFKDTGLNSNQVLKERFAVYIGGNKEVDTIPQELVESVLLSKGTLTEFAKAAKSKLSPSFSIRALPAAVLHYVSAHFDIQGPNAYFVGTSNASAAAIGSGFRSIRHGEADAALVGGFSDSITWWNYMKLDAMGVLHRGEANDCRKLYAPFDKKRNGTLIAEGSTMLVLEELEQAKKRGANIYAEIIGFGNGYDSGAIAKPSPNGAGLQVAMRKAMRDGSVGSEHIDYVCAHGSGTKLGDESEVRAIESVFGTDRSVMVSSVKPTTGHMVSNAGAFNALASVLTLSEQVVPFTLNCETLEDNWSLDFIRHEPRQTNVNYVMSVARGLEGQDTALLFAKWK